FITQGIFKTNLGDIIADINLEIKGNGRYSGELLTTNFNLAELSQNKNLGFISMRANAKGEGFSLENLREDVQASIQFFDFKGYRYQNITVDGTFIEQNFSGEIEVDDKNLIVDFD